MNEDNQGNQRTPHVAITTFLEIFRATTSLIAITPGHDVNLRDTRAGCGSSRNLQGNPYHDQFPPPPPSQRAPLSLVV